MRLFGFGRRERAPYSVPRHTRVYAVGDIHGRADLLRDLQAMILEDATGYDEFRKVIVYIGDYVDRGLQSREVIELLLDSPLPGFEVVYLKGNHEALMLDFLEDVKSGPGWLEIGGSATLFSYGVSMSDQLPLAKRLAEAQSELKRQLPERHLHFLYNLSLQHSEGDYLFVHAGIRPRKPLDGQTEQDLLWIRGEFLESVVDHGKMVVHGHSITWEPEVRSNRIGIDTGAFASGVLTCLILNGTDHKFLQARQ